ncbi:hypothetical protein BV394_11275 [Brevirhabdus pacifica]|uniref:Probable branched-chain-amino-acid aminotransferase n=1 Tax=Brevirhabdus pacifica TaxID=1267768 RepID=A0A1U7DJS6_9RHOB|nr:aminotransferase class IV [Brevirhabdus pacifica]APX90236.1 hypothetical protein BV394_11275 [Brevirhabdus pacifica]OWU78890.1 hypothetical protein ATO5_08180 [Loktanella sp. 22II-4b]
MTGPDAISVDPHPLLIETLGWDGQCLNRRDLHQARLARSAAALGYPHDPAHVAEALDRIAGPAPLRVRLTLDATGRVELTSAALPPTPASWRVMLADTRLDEDDPWLRHKTGNRALYDRHRADLPQGVDEVIFVNRAGRMAEGTITNLFYRLPGAGDLFTPPLADGCLPGCLRAELLARGDCTERSLPLSDLGSVPLFCGNSLRGLIPATLTSGPAPTH